MALRQWLTLPEVAGIGLAVTAVALHRPKRSPVAFALMFGSGELPR